VNRVEIIRTADVPPVLLAAVAAGIERVLQIKCRVRPDPVSIAVPPDPARGQLHSTAVLQWLQFIDGVAGRLVAVTGADLFVPVLTFVFGEAQLPGRYAVVSTHRLREEFYGLPPNDELLEERLVKEAIHELGHTYGMVHCDDWECVMTSSHAVERLDVKRASLCRGCGRDFRLRLDAPLHFTAGSPPRAPRFRIPYLSRKT
jgi:archaemetzincin